MDNFLLIIGAMKSGTTSLFKYLASHPEIAPCRDKEPHYFVRDDMLARGWSWYETLWDWDPGRHKYAMEASTGYTKLPLFPNAAERIATAPAHFKFLYIMRNPIARIESHSSHGLSVGWGTTTERPDRQRLHDQLIAVSSYARQLDEYYRRFPKEDIKLLFYEDLAENPNETLAEVCNFLGLAPSFDETRLGRAYNRSNFRVANDTLRRVRWSPIGRIAAALAPPAVIDKIKLAAGGKPVQRMKLSDRQKQEVLQALLPDLRRLREEYGVDVARWGIEL